MVQKPYVDYTLLRADATLEDFMRFCEQAVREENQYIIRSVCVLPDPQIIALCKNKVKGSGVLVSTVNDFPLGRSGRAIKGRAALIAKNAGADEIDTKINTSLVKEGKYLEVRAEIGAVVEIFPTGTKVIIESGHSWYTEKMIKEVTSLVAAMGAFCIKTSTGIIDNIPPDAKLQHVAWMHEAAPTLTKKLSGGIQKLSQVKPFWKVVPPDKLIVGASTQFWKKHLNI